MSADSTHIHDILGVGIGPFGLGLAALSEPLNDVDAIFVDQRPEFRWHPGMMIEGSTIQVPFLADLVTMADPTSPYSFLNFLKERRRLYPFYIRESFYPLRAEFDEYCRWVAAQLDSLRWNRRVVSVTKEDGVFTALTEVADDSGSIVTTETYRARHLVLGVGTQPVLPPALQGVSGDGNADTAGPLIHTADYLENREALLESGAITIVGSGQSAAEIYRDLIDDAEDRGVRLDWVTRSPRFFPMEYTKLTLEMTSPEYTDHFRALPDELRERVGREQRTLYKGISADLVDDIHDTLYRLSRCGRRLLTNLISEAELETADIDPISGEFLLGFRNTALDKTFTRRSGSVVAATGFKSQVPDFLSPLGDDIRLDSRGRLDVSRHYTINDEGTIHVVGGEEHTHGVTAPDLGFGPWRASVVLAAVTGREPYPIERTIAFQTFGVPADESDASALTAADSTDAGSAAGSIDHDSAAGSAAFALDDSKEMTHA
ncbi:lysine N6-hydroxylase [Brevibacterium siliguriense]|uniref:L-lysine N6-monooxygenase MbtG n=1 Tax=Brevibacterium siliguriense TaxID=1136497 RepID=A0A1H1QWW5_9MICO|nr:SidA/IucD/PvdA family monooxygenase [Brevibacterium siliguriense]SDS27863.1 lysine N6-hydroxylase [Brevibacterium siliguriense]